MTQAPSHRPGTANEANGLGIAGFVISLVGLCSGGILSPIGLIISIVAATRQPRALAVAGIVLGAIGSCGILLALLFVPVLIAGILAAIGLGAAGVSVAGALGGPELQAKVEMGILTAEIRRYKEQHQGALPSTLDVLPKPYEGVRTDPWNRPYVYELKPDGSGFTLFSAGLDGVRDTTDDIHLDDRDKKVKPTEGTPTSEPTTTPASQATPPGDAP